MTPTHRIRPIEAQAHTVAEALQNAARSLQGHSDSPRLDAEFIRDNKITPGWQLPPLPSLSRIE